MRKFLCICISVISALFFNGCGMIYIDDSEEQTAYQETMDSLFDALDTKNGDAIYHLFSPAVREQDSDMKEQIEKLLSAYKGTTDAIGWDGLLAGGASYDSGNVSKYAYTTFPIRSGDLYFWCYLEIIYKDTFDENQIGITQLEFYTAEEYYLLTYDDDTHTTDTVGLQVYAEKTVPEDIRCINDWPYKYSLSTKELDVDDVKNFFKSQCTFSAFKTSFGDPNAEGFYCCYSLLPENGKPRYLEIQVEDNVILYASIVDDFSYIETLYEKDKP